MKTFTVISESKDGGRAQLVERVELEDGKMISRTHHAVTSGRGNWKIRGWDRQVVEATGELEKTKKDA